MTARSIQFESKKINFRLSRSDRKTMGVTVTPEMSVLVMAPNGASINKIKAKVRKLAPWIIKQENFFLTFHPRTPPPKYVGGESHLYLGRHYRLSVRIGKKEQVEHKGRLIEVTTRKKSNVKRLVLNWYRYHAKTKFPEIAEPWILKFKRYKVEPSGLYIQAMATRWGSCTPRGKIILNPELIKAPKRCIEYVIVHELCHLVHHNHTGKFFELQKKVMPDWEKWKERLERVMA